VGYDIKVTIKYILQNRERKIERKKMHGEASDVAAIN
jgi:hypothetical protein